MECDVFDWSEEEWCESDESNYCEENEWEELKSENKKLTVFERQVREDVKTFRDHSNRIDRALRGKPSKEDR